jgi:hypothetical protein
VNSPAEAQRTQRTPPQIRLLKPHLQGIPLRIRKFEVANQLWGWEDYHKKFEIDARVYICPEPRGRTNRLRPLCLCGVFVKQPVWPESLQQVSGAQQCGHDSATPG